MTSEANAAKAIVVVTPVTALAIAVTQKTKKRKRWENPRHTRVREAIGLLLTGDCLTVIFAFIDYVWLDEGTARVRRLGCAACFMKLPGHRPCLEIKSPPPVICRLCFDSGCWECDQFVPSACQKCGGPITGERKGHWHKCHLCDPYGYREWLFDDDCHTDDCETWNCLGYCVEDHCREVDYCHGPCKGGHKDRF